MNAFLSSHRSLSDSDDAVRGLLAAQEKALLLFERVVESGLIRPGATELDLSQAIYERAFEWFGIRKYWHKRIVRAGRNTLAPYRENPPNLTLREDEILFFDFGPVFEEWEADVGRTYVLGSDPRKHRLKADVERAFELGKRYFEDNRDSITCSRLYAYIRQLARDSGWNYDIPHAGHLVGRFPHEKMADDPQEPYITPDNHSLMSAPDANGNPRHWILEVHFLDPDHEIGAFQEQLLTL